MNMQPSTSKIVQVPRLKKERISLESAQKMSRPSPVKDPDWSPNESIIHKDWEESPMEISITSGFCMPEETSGNRAKTVKRQDRKTENRGETYRQLKRSNTIIEAVRLHKVIDD